MLQAAIQMQAPCHEADDINEVPISELDISPALIKRLNSLGINTIGDLLKKDPRSLVTLPGLGWTSVKKIEEALDEFAGLKLPKKAVVDSKPEKPPIASGSNLALLRPVEDLKLSVRALNVVKPIKKQQFHHELDLGDLSGGYIAPEDNINLIGELVQLKEQDLYHRQSCGKKTVQELKDALKRFGLSFGMKITDWNQETVSGLREKNREKIRSTRKQELAAEYEKLLQNEDNTVEGELAALLKLFMFKNKRYEETWYQFWGWDGKGKKTLEEVGQIHGVTRERIRQIIERHQVKLQRTVLPILPRTKKVDEAFAYISKHTLHTKDQVEKGLVSAGITRDIFDVTAFLGLAEFLDKKVTWDVAKVNGKEFVVTPKERKAAKTILSYAKRLVSHYGFTTLEELSSRIAEEKLGQYSEDKIRELLTLLDAPYWLDEEQTTLFIRTSRNRLFTGITKMLAACGPLNVTKIKEGLRRHTRILRVPSADVLLAFCKLHDIFHVEGHVIHLDQNVRSENVLSKTEQDFIRVFNTHGKIQAYEEIREHCLKDGINEHTFEVYLSGSSIVDRVAPGIYALRGTEADPFRIGSLTRQYRAPTPSSDQNEVGWTTTGKLWAICSATPPILRTGITPLPKAASQHLDGEYSLVALNGEEFGVLKTGKSSVWSLKKALRAKGAEYNDQFILVFDLTGKTAIIEVGDSEILDRAKEGKFLQVDEELDDEADDEELEELEN